MSLLILKFHSHDHQTDKLLRESRHDNSKPIIIASSATTTLSNIYSSHGQLYPTFILHSSYIIFTDHTTFHSHDHRTDNLLKESRHDNSRHITIASLVIIIPQLRHDNNKQITFFSGHTTFHSHDHQTDTLLRESRHDNSRQITIASLAITILSKQRHRVFTLFTITGKLQTLQNNSNV